MSIRSSAFALSLILAFTLASAGCKAPAPDRQRPVPPAAPLTPKPPVFFSADFEGGNVKGFDLSWLANKWAAKVVGTVARGGRRALEISLRRSDKMESKGKRAELLVPYTYRHGHGYWYGLSVYLPKSWKEDFQGDVVAQWFANEDKDLGEKGRSPALALRVTKRFWYVTNRWDTRRVTLNNSGHKEKIYKTPYQTGRWTDWVFHVRWSYDKDAPAAKQGLIEVYKNGKKVAEKRGPNCYNDRLGLSLKMGIYKAPWNDPDEPSAVSERLLYLDEVRIGSEEAGYAGVAPRGQDAPASQATSAPASQPTSKPVPPAKLPGAPAKAGKTAKTAKPPLPKRPATAPKSARSTPGVRSDQGRRFGERNLGGSHDA